MFDVEYFTQYVQCINSTPHFMNYPFLIKCKKLLKKLKRDTICELIAIKGKFIEVVHIYCCVEFRKERPF